MTSTSRSASTAPPPPASATAASATPASVTPASATPASVTPASASRRAGGSTAAAFTAVAAALLGVLGLLWTLTGRGYPFGPGDDGNDGSLIRTIPADTGAPLLAALLLPVALLASLWAAGRLGAVTGARRRTVLVAAWTVVALLLFVLPDTRLLALAGYAPMLIIGGPLGLFDIEWGTVFDVTLGVQLLSVTTGVLLARATLTWQRATAGHCAACGRGPVPARWTAPQAAARWGRWAVAVAMTIPLLYAATRYAWLLGIRFGISGAQLRDLHESGGVWAGAGLATFAVAGAALTLGLVQGWGERFPRWMPRLAGRPVPVRLATIPAGIVSVLVMAAGLSLLSVPLAFEEPALTWPALLWPIWSVALGGAAYAYYLRRRGACEVCAQE